MQAFPWKCRALSFQANSKNSISPISQLPHKGQFNGDILTEEGEDRIKGTWETCITKGKFEATKFESVSPSPPNLKRSWDEFKGWALKERRENKEMIFRGHDSNRHRLTTSFHRTGRRDLIRYLEDVETLSRHIEATLGKSLNPGNPQDFGGLLSLVQHHGYPTPLLDWTDSPFVAAYYAFSTLKKTDLKDENWVRVFAFDVEKWSKSERMETIRKYGELVPQFRPMRLPSPDNPRALPQQSVHMFSNIVDIEKLVALQEKQQRQKYLTRIDIREIERPRVMKELEIMGITAASLFPGIEGVCRALAERDFE